MTKRLRTRLEQATEAMARAPIGEDVVQAAFERFGEDGELPDDRRLATSVTERALRRAERSGAPEKPSFADALNTLLRIAEEQIRFAEDPSATRTVDPRRALFHEAVHGDDLVRGIARALLVWHARNGADVTSAEFLADETPPAHGSFGLHLLGFPECLAKPPYVRQARRLLARLDEVRTRIEHDDPGWREPVESAIRRFRHCGELPPDDLARDCALVDGELHALMAHFLERGDPALISAFDRAARGAANERGQALADLGQLVRAGRLHPDIR